MSIKVRSLGTAVAATRGITVSALSNASPVVATFNARSRVKDGERFALFGTTGNTGANGIFEIDSMEYSGYTANLKGSVGNGTATLTKTVVACVFDKTPFMKGHSAAVKVAKAVDSIAFDGTFAIMGVNDDLAAATDDAILASDSDDLATYFESVVDGEPFTVPGATNDGSDEIREIKLRRFMYLNVSSYTAGGIDADILA